MPLSIDTGKIGLEMFFKPYQVVALRVLQNRARINEYTCLKCDKIYSLEQRDNTPFCNYGTSRATGKQG